MQDQTSAPASTWASHSPASSASTAETGIEVGGHGHELDQIGSVTAVEVLLAVGARESFAFAIEVSGGAVEPCAKTVVVLTA